MAVDWSVTTDERQDDLLAELAISSGYMSRDDLKAAVDAQQSGIRAAGIRLPLHYFLTGKGVLTTEHVQELMHEVAVRAGGSRRIGGYEIGARIGVGGFGTVYQARNTTTSEMVALKMLKPSVAGPDFVKRFHREAEAVASLNHPGIVRFLESAYDAEYDVHYCVYELIRGRTIREIIEQDGVMVEDDGIVVVSHIAQALSHAHQRRLVHRDVKPGNIMLSDDGDVKLLDFGLARPTGDSVTRLTRTGAFLGSVQFASPETAEHRGDVDIRSDIYSLGATFYFMTTGRPPFEGGTEFVVLEAIVYEQLQWPAEVNPALSDATCHVISRMMEKSPDERYQTPDEVVDDLTKVAAGGMPAHVPSKTTTSSIAYKGAQESETGKRIWRPRPRDTALNRRILPVRRSTGFRLFGGLDPISALVAGIVLTALLISLGVWLVLYDPLSPVGPSPEEVRHRIEQAEREREMLRPIPPE